MQTFDELLKTTQWDSDIVMDFAISFLQDKELTQEFIDYCMECFESEDGSMSIEDLQDLMNIGEVFVEKDTLENLNEQQRVIAIDWISKVIMNNFNQIKLSEMPQRPDFLN